MATYGAKALTRIAVASQSAFGTAASIGTAVGEILFNDTIGSLDLGITVDLGEAVSVGKRTAIQASQPIITGKAPMITIAEAPASMRTLPIIFDSIGATTSGTAVPYTWTWSPTQGDVDTLLFESFLVTDGVQKYLIRDAVPTEITLSADANGLVLCHKDGTEIRTMKRSFNALLAYAGVPIERDGMARTIYSLPWNVPLGKEGSFFKRKGSSSKT
ncbi:MAG: hypothetical protein WCO86_13010 [Planctomycetota bacterium]